MRIEVSNVPAVSCRAGFYRAEPCFVSCRVVPDFFIVPWRVVSCRAVPCRVPNRVIFLYRVVPCRHVWPSGRAVPVPVPVWSWGRVVSCPFGQLGRAGPACLIDRAVPCRHARSIGSCCAVPCHLLNRVLPCRAICLIGSCRVFFSCRIVMCFLNRVVLVQVILSCHSQNKILIPKQKWKIYSLCYLLYLCTISL